VLPADDLEQAKKALETFDEPRALEAMLRAWRETRSPELAEIIEELSPRFDIASRRPHGGSVADRRASWLSIARENDPINVTSLLATLESDANAAELATRVRTLGEGAPDPRIAMRLTRLMIAPGEGRTNDGFRPFWTEVLKTIRAMGDPRAKEFGASIAGQISPTAPPKSRWFNRELAVNVFAELPAAKVVDAAAIGSLRSALTGGHGSKRGTVSELIEKVYANPEDDSVRAVLADLLQEIRDPRGELISLQLSPKGDKKREAALLKEHRAAWLGPLAPVIYLGGPVVFRRGFLEECTLFAEDRSDVAQAVNRPEWTTVTKIRQRSARKNGWYGMIGTLLASPYAMAIEEALDISIGDLVTLPSPRPKLARVSVSTMSTSELLRAGDLVPNLRRLICTYVSYFDSLAPFLSTPLVQRLDTFEVHLSSEQAIVDLFVAALDPEDERELRPQRILAHRAATRTFSWSLTGEKLSTLTAMFTAKKAVPRPGIEGVIANVAEAAGARLRRVCVVNPIADEAMNHALASIVETLKVRFPAIQFETLLASKTQKVVVGDEWDNDY